MYFRAPASGITPRLLAVQVPARQPCCANSTGLTRHFAGYRASGSVKVDLANGLCEIMSGLAMPLCQLRRRVGMVFQTPDVLPTSIRRNLLMPLKIVAGLDSREAGQQMIQALQSAGLWHEVRDRLDAPAEKSFRRPETKTFVLPGRFCP